MAGADVVFSKFALVDVVAFLVAEGTSIGMLLRVEE